MGGVLSSLPLLAASGATGLSAALTVGSTLGSCFLFGVTYRCAKIGVGVGFGLTERQGGGRCLGLLGGLCVRLGHAAWYASGRKVVVVPMACI